MNASLDTKCMSTCMCLFRFTRVLFAALLM